MTPTKRNPRGASAGLVLLVFTVVALFGTPIAARAADTVISADPQTLAVDVKTPGHHRLTQGAVPIRITCQTPSGTTSSCRTSLRISFQNSSGQPLKVPASAHSAICHAGSDQAGRCWVPAGETTTFRRAIGTRAKNAIKRELKHGPVQMRIEATVLALSGAKTAATATVDLGQ